MSPKRAASPMTLYRRLAMGFLAIVGLLAIVALFASLARVRIKITPRAELVAADFDVRLVGSGSPREDEVQGRLIRVDGTADGTVAAAEAPAVVRGAPALVVTLVNTQPTPQPLIVKTRLISPEGVQFRMAKGVTIPAKGRLPNVEVVYDTAYAQPANVNLGGDIPRKYKIPGLTAWLQERVWGESAGSMQPSEGGTPELPRVSVGEADVRRRATDDAGQRIVALKVSGEESIVLSSSMVVTPSGKTVRAVATVTALFADKKAIEKRAELELQRMATSEGRALVRMQADKLRFNEVVQQDAATGSATIRVHAEGEIAIPKGSRSFEPARIAGFDADGVQTYLKSISGVKDVEVRFWPFWVKRVPTSAGSVDVEITEPVK